MTGWLTRGLRRFVRDAGGAYQVEFAIVFPVLMVLSLGLLEFSLVAFDFQRAAEATRRGVRFVIIGNNVPNTANLLSPPATIVCTAPGGVVSCTGATVADAPDFAPGHGQANFDATLATMAAIYPPITADNIRITYSSTQVGDPTLSGGVIPLVTIELFGVQHSFVTGPMIGVPTMTLPDFKTTVLGSGRTINAT